MLCENCKSKPASVHITQIIGGKKKELNLCSGCASHMGIAIGASMFEPMEALLASLLEPVEENAARSARCPSCGSDFSVFQNTGRLGCPQCYQVFTAELMPFIQKTQRGQTHTGARPDAAGHKQADSTRQTLENARQALSKAIQSEEFEQAAALRDQIRALEASLSKNEQKGGDEHAGLA